MELCRSLKPMAHQQQEVCSICLEVPNPDQLIKLECAHLFCTDCFLQYFDRNLKVVGNGGSNAAAAVITCPNCRKQIYESRYPLPERQQHIILVQEEPVETEGERVDEKRVLMLHCMFAVSLILFLWTYYLQEMKMHGR